MGTLKKKQKPIKLSHIVIGILIGLPLAYFLFLAMYSLLWFWGAMTDSGRLPPIPAIRIP